MSTSFGGWTPGVQVKLWDPLRTRAIPERLTGVFTTRRYTNPRLPLPYSPPSPPIDNIRAMMFSGGKRGDNHNCSVLYCVLKLCTSTLRWAVLTVLWIEVMSQWAYFAVHRFISVYVCLFCVFLFYTTYLLYYCELWWGELDGIEA